MSATPIIGTGASLVVAPVAVSQGHGPASYNQTNSALGASGGLTLSLLGLTNTGLQFNTGVASTSASGIGTTATASATLASANLGINATTQNLFGPATVVSLLGLRTGEIRSTASVDAAGLFQGSSSIAGLGLTTTLGTVNAGLLGNVTPAVNAVLLDVLGLKITLNEQITDGDMFTTNALSLRFTNFVSGTNLVNGAVILGQSQVVRATPVAPPAVPEPATWAMMIAGFGMVGAAMRSRRRIMVLA
nr:PEPxxWA-CTERM sorting domain-containing protein [Sphingomonas jejuensis]